MATWSLPVQQTKGGWKLRVLSGTSLGKEFDLPLRQYVLGSRAPANIVIPDSSIAPQHVAIEILPQYVLIKDCSGGAGMSVNGKPLATAQLVPGDHVLVGTFKFEFSNPSYVSSAPATRPGSLYRKFARWSLPLRVGLVTLTVAAVLFLLLVTTLNPHLVPVTLIAMSAVVPATMICYLVEKYDKTGISFHTLTITFLAGGTLGIICAMFGFIVGGFFTGGLLVLGIFAGIWEEPAKFLATSWRWRHPGYDRPMDGLILGTVSGLGFAVFETAGYGFRFLLEEQDFGKMLRVLVMRSLTSPFGHGLWSGILAAAFWQCGRDLKRAVRERVFQVAALWAVGLHALWNAAGTIPGLSLGCVLLSALLGVREYRKLLLNKGYRG